MEGRNGKGEMREGCNERKSEEEFMDKKREERKIVIKELAEKRAW